MSVIIARTCVDSIIRRAREDNPNETCGFLLGRNGAIEDIHPMRNVSKESLRRYEFDAKEHLRAFRQADAEGLPIAGVYHSHPYSEAYPSPTDVACAIIPSTREPTYPDYVYLIASLASEPPVVRAFRIESAGTILELELKIK